MEAEGYQDAKTSTGRKGTLKQLFLRSQQLPMTSGKYQAFSNIHTQLVFLLFCFIRVRPFIKSVSVFGILWLLIQFVPVIFPIWMFSHLILLHYIITEWPSNRNGTKTYQNSNMKMGVLDELNHRLWVIRVHSATQVTLMAPGFTGEQ